MTVCEVYKNSREKIIFQVSGFRGQQYGDALDKNIHYKYKASKLAHHRR